MFVPCRQRLMLPCSSNWIDYQAPNEERWRQANRRMCKFCENMSDYSNANEKIIEEISGTIAANMRVRKGLIYWNTIKRGQQ